MAERNRSALFLAGAYVGECPATNFFWRAYFFLLFVFFSVALRFDAPIDGRRLMNAHSL